MVIWPGTSFEDGTIGQNLDVYDNTHFNYYDGNNGSITISGVAKTGSRGVSYNGGSDVSGEQQYITVEPSGSLPYAKARFSIRNNTFYSFDGDVDTVKIYNGSGQVIFAIQNQGGATKNWYLYGASTIDSGIQIQAATYWYSFEVELLPSSWRVTIVKTPPGSGVGPDYYQSGWIGYQSSRTFDRLVQMRFSGYGSAGASDNYVLDDLEFEEYDGRAMYKLICDYDGTCDWSGTNRELYLRPLAFNVGDYNNEGEIFERADMPWDTSKVVGSREFRTRNLELTMTLLLSNETDVRILEAWNLLFPSLFVPSRKFDYAKYYDNSVSNYYSISEKPQSIGYGNVYFEDTNDRLYIGSQTQKFSALDIWLDRNGVGGTYVWEYSTGTDTWSTLTVTNGTWTGTTKAYWTPPSNWVKATMTGLSSDKLYYVRCRCSATPSTAPRIVFIKRHRPISVYLMSSSDGGVNWDFWYKIYTSGKYFPNGFCFKSVTRVLTPGEPKKYMATAELVEVNY